MNNNLLTPHTRERLLDAGLLFLRLGAGGLMLFSHGIPKLDRLAQDPIQFADPLGLGPAISLWLALGAEIVCASLLVLGLGTRIAAVPLIITMLVAALIVHGDDPFQKKEFALVYGMIFFTIMLTGPGKFSLDALIAKRRSKAQ